MAPHSVFLPGESRRQEPGGLLSIEIRTSEQPTDACVTVEVRGREERQDSKIRMGSFGFP